MAYTTIDDPSAYFQIATYTGNGSTQSITNDGNSDLQPDWVWIKSRSDTSWHSLQDSSRGATKTLFTNTTNAEATYTNAQTSFDSDGFSLGADTSGGSVNVNSRTYVAWQWKVNGGTTTSLTSNINSVCQVNQDAGISIVKYTCTGGGNGQSVQHGLGLVPQVIITKNRTDANYSDWITYHHSIGYTNFVKLNSTAASATNSPYNGAAPTSTTYNVSIDLVEQKDFVSYVFAPIQGYSKFGKYVGNGHSNGSFIYLGFKPAFVIIRSSSIAGQWLMFDNKRDEADRDYLIANSSAAESDAGLGNSAPIDFLSNGFKLRNTDAWANGSNTYVYMAWAENPFVTSTGIPTTTR